MRTQLGERHRIDVLLSLQCGQLFPARFQFLVVLTDLGLHSAIRRRFGLSLLFQFSPLGIQRLHFGVRIMDTPFEGGYLLATVVSVDDDVQTEVFVS